MLLANFIATKKRKEYRLKNENLLRKKVDKIACLDRIKET
jgi:hypothetical protein